MGHKFAFNSLGLTGLTAQAVSVHLGRISAVY